MNSLSVIDCATETLSNNCFNRLVDYFNIPMKFHCPSMFAMDSLKKDNARAYIVFGSYSNVEDRLKWQKDLAIFLDKKLQEGIPVLGICFAHQLMADYYGAKVTKNIKDTSHNGVRKVQLEDKQLTFFVSHSYQVRDLPLCLQKLGSSQECENEVIQHKTLPFLSIQGHPEASEFFIKSTLANVNITNEQKNDASRDGMIFIEDFLRKNNLL